MRDHWWWRPGWRLGRRAYTFHVTFTDETVEGAADLRRLAGEHQVRLAGMQGLDLVPLKWLHLTMQNVGFTDHVSMLDVDAVAKEALAACTQLASFDLTFDAVEVQREGIAFRPTPAEAVCRLRDVVRVAIGSVLGENAVPEAPEHAQGFNPHVSLAYGSRESPAEPYLAAVKSVELNPAVVKVLAASLIVLDRDQRVYRWTTYDTIRLG